MRHGKRPKSEQKKRLMGYGLNPGNWLVIKDYKGIFIIISKATGKIKRFEDAKGWSEDI